MAHEDISELLKAGIQAAKDRKKAEARRLLEQVLEIDDGNEPAWMWLASVVDTPREKRICLENVLEINPNNARAREALAALGPVPTTAAEPLRPGQQAGSAPQPRPAAGAPVPTARRRSGLNPIVFIGGGILAFALIAIGLLMAFNTFGTAATPTPVVTAPAAVALNATLATLLPNGILVTSDATSLPTFTPTSTNTPNPTSTPTPPLPPLTDYRIAYTDPKNVVWAVLADGSQKAPFFGNNAPSAPDLAFSKAGKSVYVGTVNNKPQIFVADFKGQNGAAVTKFDKGEFVSEPTISPDGTTIAFVVADPGSKEDPATREIDIINVDGSGLKQLTSNDVEDRDPAWSPDGKQLAFASDPTGKKNLQIFNTDLSGQKPKQLTTSTGNNYSPCWSPDGKSIAFVSTRDRFENIYILEVANSLNARILTYDGGESSNRSPSWSSDGVFIVFASNRNGNVYHLYLMTPNAKFIQKIAGQDDKTDSLNPRFIPE